MVVIPIPIGASRTAIVQGAVWKFVLCSHCQERYAYRMKMEATGTDLDVLFLDAEDSAKRAQANAEKNFKLKSKNMVLPVPCPNCGFYQEDMLQRLKEESTISKPMIAGLIIALLSLIPLAFSIPYLWIMTVVGVSIGVALMVYYEVAELRFDPNAGDPEPRKQIGQKRSLWGKQLEKLEKLLADIPMAEPVVMTDSQNDQDSSNDDVAPT